MAVRAGMFDLIRRLRAGAAAQYDEFAFAGESYFTDTHLQEHLDRHRVDIYREPLVSKVTYNDSNTAQYFDYYFTYDSVETAPSGATIWQVENSAGSAVGTADYTVNYQARHIQFASNTAGSAYYLSYRRYNVEEAVADVWDFKAANVANRYDVSTDNHRVSRGQLYEMYTKEATKWRARAISVQKSGAAGEGYLLRSDVNV